MIENDMNRFGVRVQDAFNWIMWKLGTKVANLNELVNEI